MSILGKIFKQKLDERQFEFKEEYWKELEKKLDSSGGGKGGFWFSLSAVTLLVIVVLLIKPKNEISESTEILRAYETENTENMKSNSDYLQASSEISDAKKEAEKYSVKPNSAKSEIPVKEEKVSSSLKKSKDEKSENLSEKNENVKNEKEEFLAETFLEKLNPEIIEKIYSKEEKEKNSFIADAGMTNEKKLTSFVHLELMNKISPNEIQKNNHEELQTKAFKCSRAKFNYFIGAYSGLMYSEKILESNDTALTEYISRRKSEETAMLSKNFGIDFGISKNRWSVSAGINYHQQGEISDYKPEFYQWMKNTKWNVQDNSYWQNSDWTITVLVDSSYWQQTDTTITYINSYQQLDTVTISLQQYVEYDLQQYTITVQDSSYVQKNDSTPEYDSAFALVNDPSQKPQKTITKFSYIEIPLMLGYEFPVNRFTIMMRTGASIGILSKFNATYLKKDVSGTEQINVQQMNKTVFNYLLRASVLYHLTEHVAFNIEPMFRMNLNSVLKDNSFSQKYWNAGVNAGVVYKF